MIIFGWAEQFLGVKSPHCGPPHLPSTFYSNEWASMSKYEQKVRALEQEGMSTSDAQAVVDAENLSLPITNVRYGDLGKILFDHDDRTIAIKEPYDVLLVGVDPAAAEKWIKHRYGFLL